MIFSLLYIWPPSMAPAWPAKCNQTGLASVLSLWASWTNEVCGIREARGQSVNEFFVWRCCYGIREEMKRMLRRDKNRVLWQSKDFFSGERNRKLASTAAYITELEMCVGSHATSFSLYFFLSLSHYLFLSLLFYTHSDSQPFSAHTSYLSTWVAWQIHCVLLHNPWIETQPAFPQKWLIPQSCCILPFFVAFLLSFADSFIKKFCHSLLTFMSL